MLKFACCAVACGIAVGCGGPAAPTAHKPVAVEGTPASGVQSPSGTSDAAYREIGKFSKDTYGKGYKTDSDFSGR
jgi:hypothetical protein